MAARNQEIPSIVMKKPILLPTVAFVFAAILPSSGLSQGAPPSAEEEINLDDYIVVEDYIKPFRDIRPAPSEAGRISEIFVKNGDSVEADQLILKLDTSVQETSLEIAKLEANSTALVDAAKAEVELAQIKVDTLDRLTTKNPQEVRRAAADLLIAQARQKAEEENKIKAGHRVKQIEAEIRRRSIHSPFAGVVVDIDRDISEFLSPNEKPVVHIIQLDRLRIHIPLSSKYGNKLSTGMKLQILLKDQQITSTEGTIEFIDAIDESASGTFRIGLVIENADMKIRPGSDAAVLIPRMLVGAE